MLCAYGLLRTGCTVSVVSTEATPASIKEQLEQMLANLCISSPTKELPENRSRLVMMELPEDQEMSADNPGQVGMPILSGRDSTPSRVPHDAALSVSRRCRTRSQAQELPCTGLSIRSAADGACSASMPTNGPCRAAAIATDTCPLLWSGTSGEQGHTSSSQLNPTARPPRKRPATAHVSQGQPQGTGGV